MSRIRANKITDKIGTGAIELEKGAHLPIGMGITGAGGLNISGVITATSFSGSGAALTGIDATAVKDSGGNVKIQAQASGAVYTGIHTFTNLTATNLTGTVQTAAQPNITSVGTLSSLNVSGSVSVGGTLTYEDVTNIDSVGLVTAREGIFIPDSKEIKIGNTAGTPDTKIFHDGTDTIFNQRTGSKFEVQTDHFRIRNTADTVNMFSADVNGPGYLYFNGVNKLQTSNTGVTVTGTVAATAFTGDGSGLTNIVGLTTEALTTAGATVTLDLTKDDHKITKSGTYTVTCTGGSEGSSHSLRIENSGTSSVSFSSYFKFPSGGTPSLPTTNGAISLISFTVHKAGSVGVNTVLLAGASVNYSWG